MTETTGRLDRGDGRQIAWSRVAGAGPTLVWLGGFHSDMTGTKAQALADWATQTGQAFLRFDYFGHGRSSGEFRDGTISRWRGDVLAVLDQLVTGPVVLVGSSMGGWLSVLAAQARPERVAGMILIAPAADFTEALMKPGFPPEAHVALSRDGVWRRPSAYEDGAYEITRALLDDGAGWCVLPGPIMLDMPVRILQSGQDPDVPWRHAWKLAQAITSADLVFTLIRDGDHRLSRPQDLSRLLGAADDIITAGK